MLSIFVLLRYFPFCFLFFVIINFYIDTKVVIIFLTTKFNVKVYSNLSLRRSLANLASYFLYLWGSLFLKFSLAKAFSKNLMNPSISFFDVCFFTLRTFHQNHQLYFYRFGLIYILDLHIALLLVPNLYQH